LVGTTVHSGTANAGHYWSYIDTKRGYQEADESDVNWNKIENDPWMEFNDSRVSEFNFEKLREECYGDQSKGGASSGYDGGDS
jgi:ubiquitin C-terminal hydrolase